MDFYAQNNALDYLTTELDAAKLRETGAKESRISIENKISDLFGELKQGANTKKLTHYKLTLTAKDTIKIDWEYYDRIISDNKIPMALSFKVQKSDVDKERYKYLKQNEPDVFKLLSPAITEKPAKIAFAIKAINHD